MSVEQDLLQVLEHTVRKLQAAHSLLEVKLTLLERENTTLKRKLLIVENEGKKTKTQVTRLLKKVFPL